MRQCGVLTRRDTVLSNVRSRLRPSGAYDGPTAIVGPGHPAAAFAASSSGSSISSDQQIVLTHDMRSPSGWPVWVLFLHRGGARRFRNARDFMASPVPANQSRPRDAYQLPKH